MPLFLCVFFFLDVRGVGSSDLCKHDGDEERLVGLPDAVSVVLHRECGTHMGVRPGTCAACPLPAHRRPRGLKMGLLRKNKPKTKQTPCFPAFG